jgi:hypothetical protein
MLASECQFKMSWIDEEGLRLVEFVDPEIVMARCGEASHVNLVLERS